jgi:hypothetical protein
MYGKEWYDKEWYGVVWCGKEWYGMVRIVWCRNGRMWYVYGMVSLTNI